MGKLICTLSNSKVTASFNNEFVHNLYNKLYCFNQGSGLKLQKSKYVTHTVQLLFLVTRFEFCQEKPVLKEHIN